MKLLIIEDTKELAKTMKAGLEKAGFTVDVSYNGCDGEEKAYANGYDAILLDLNLPGKDGISILRFLRSENIGTPVIIITARDEIEERAMGLDLGADDYLTKPFQLLELRARVHAVIRRFHGRTNPNIAIGFLTINPSARVAKINEKKLNLSAKEFDILEYLAMNHPNVISSEEIAEHIYDDSFDPFSSVLRVHLTRLRKKLADAARQDVLITMRGKGYSLWVD
ncbi:two-component system response regulator QseB [Lachnospiraceae bacterium PF1-21]|nr:response regulator transcription factor [Lachnospiraceae bacterium OttesenSCG-928-J05]